MQTKDDGKHDILPVATRVLTRWNHARVPVMMPRESDGKMRLDGSTAAQTRHKHPVDERGGVHGVPELSFDVEQRVAEKTIVYFNVGSEKRRWRKRSRPTARLGGQDKSTCHARIEAAGAASLSRGSLFGRVHVERQSSLNSIAIYAQAPNPAFAELSARLA